MKLLLDRQKRLTLLKWLKQGYIETLDLPEALQGYNFFEEIMKETDRAEEEGEG